MSRDDYLYAAGVIRHLETKLLDPTDVERMVDAVGFNASFKVFHDTDFSDNVLDVKSNEFIKALDADLMQTKQNLSEMLPDDMLIKLLFLRFDFHNIKLLLKSKYGRSNLDVNRSELGLADYEQLKKAIEEKKPEDLEEEYRNTLVRFNEEIGDTEPSPSQIDRIIDQEYFRLYYNLAMRTRNNFIVDFVKLQLDVINIKIYIRSKYLKIPKEEWLEDIIGNGNVEADEFRNIADKSIDEVLSQLLQIVKYGISDAIEDYIQHKSLEKLEKVLEEVELDYLRQAKYIDYGPEVIVAYFYAKKNAIRNTRLIMTGKLNAIPAAEIKSSIRELY